MCTLTPCVEPSSCSSCFSHSERSPPAAAATTTATATAQRPSAQESCDKGNLELVKPRRADDRHRQPGFPAVVRGRHAEARPGRSTTPPTGEGFESAVAYAVAEQLGFTKTEVTWVVVPFNQSFKPGPKDFDFDINQISFTPERAKAVDFSDSLLRRQPGARRAGGHADRGREDASPISRTHKLGAQIGTTSYDASTTRSSRARSRPSTTRTTTRSRR